jgi:hypothetical protein
LAAHGLLCSAALGVGLGVYRLVSGQSFGAALPIAALLAGPLVGMLIGLVRNRTWQSAAAAVDARYRLKDRAVTALDFVGQAERPPLRDLQIDDAVVRLRQVKAAHVAPLRWSRAIPCALVLLAIAIPLLVWPLSPSQVTASPRRPLPGILAATELLQEDLEELEELAEEQKSDELVELLENLELKLKELEAANTDVRDALATLSEMQAEIAAQQAQYNVALVDSQLKSLGAAMAAAAALQPAARDLQEGDYDEAAQELQQLEEQEMDRREAREASEQMQKVAQSMAASNLGELSGAVSALAESISGVETEGMCQAGECLGELVKQHGMRVKIAQRLARELDMLSECKSLCRGGQKPCKVCGGNCPPGQCQSNSLAEGQIPQHSESPTNSFGKTTSGQLYGEATQLDSERSLTQLVGALGEGPAEVEILHSPEGREQARRKYREIYNEYRKMSEAVLDSEPIPLGHRQIIRRYFESIRPNDTPAGDAPSTELEEPLPGP